jgi:hypothetical protein
MMLRGGQPKSQQQRVDEVCAVLKSFVGFFDFWVGVVEGMNCFSKKEIIGSFLISLGSECL